MKGIFECLTDELRFEIARQYREAIGNLDELPEEDGMAAMFALVMILPGAAERLNAEREQPKEQKVQDTPGEPEKPKKRRGGRRRKAKTDAEVDQIAGDLLAGIDI